VDASALAPRIAIGDAPGRPLGATVVSELASPSSPILDAVVRSGPHCDEERRSVLVPFIGEIAGGLHSSTWILDFRRRRARSSVHSAPASLDAELIGGRRRCDRSGRQLEARSRSCGTGGNSAARAMYARSVLARAERSRSLRIRLGSVVWASLLSSCVDATFAIAMVGSATDMTLTSPRPTANSSRPTTLEDHWP
jgi:hypothetical protein